MKIKKNNMKRKRVNVTPSSRDAVETAISLAKRRHFVSWDVAQPKREGAARFPLWPESVSH